MAKVTQNSKTNNKEKKYIGTLGFMADFVLPGLAVVSWYVPFTIHGTLCFNMVAVVSVAVKLTFMTTVILEVAFFKASAFWWQLIEILWSRYLQSNKFMIREYPDKKIYRRS